MPAVEMQVNMEFEFMFMLSIRSATAPPQPMCSALPRFEARPATPRSDRSAKTASQAAARSWLHLRLRRGSDQCSGVGYDGRAACAEQVLHARQSGVQREGAAALRRLQRDGQDIGSEDRPVREPPNAPRERA